MTRRHAIESHGKDLRTVQLMEKRLNISDRWMPGSEKWKAAMEKVSMRQYQRCLDTLEGLVVARMFKLTKMNMSQTGNLLSYIILYLFSRCLQVTASASTLAMP
jgi:hypothetical protein